MLLHIVGAEIKTKFLPMIERCISGQIDALSPSQCPAYLPELGKVDLEITRLLLPVASSAAL